MKTWKASVTIPSTLPNEWDALVIGVARKHGFSARSHLADRLYIDLETDDDGDHIPDAVLNAAAEIEQLLAAPSRIQPTVVHNHYYYNSGIANVMGPGSVASDNTNSIQITQQAQKLQDPIARREYLDAMHRAAERLRPLQAISYQFFANTRTPTLASVYVKPTVFIGSGRERATNGVPLDMVRRPGARIAILGELGTGKSVALETLRSDLAEAAATDSAAPLPVLVHARALCDGSWREVLAAHTALSRDRVAVALNESWILLVDGVDEVGGNAWDTIDNISQCNRQCIGVVAATRPTAPPPERDSYEVVRLRSWTHIEVERFLAKWQQFDPDAVNLVRHAIKSGVLRRTLLLNPLIATLCLYVSAADRKVLNSRAALLGHVTTLLFEAWRRIRGISAADLPWSKMIRPLGQLATEYLKAGGQSLSMTHVWQHMRTLLPYEEYAVQHEAEWQLGILVPGPNGTLDFALRPIAEYLAGEVIATMNDDQAAKLVAAPWALEPMRIALTLFADLDRVERALNVIERIAVAAAHSAFAMDTRFLRPLLVAIRVAADLRDAMTPVAEQLAGAIVRLVADETSSWIGDVVAEEARNLAAVGGPCWDALLDQLRPLAQRFNEEPVGWYAAQPERPAADWIPVLLHSAADVRAVAVERLAPHVADEKVRRVLAAEIWDEGYVMGGTPPAVLAGGALRHAPPDAKFGLPREMLLAAVDNGDLIASAAAALALGPSDADLPLLVRALRGGSASFMVPPGVIAEIANTAAGKQALDEGWPDWRDPRFQQTAVPRPMVPTHQPPPPSHEVRVRIAKLLAPALATLSDDDLRLFMGRTQYSRDHMLLKALESDPSLADRIDPRHVPLDAQHKLGEAALQSRSLRDRLVALWRDPDLRLRSEYPGLSLEPLIEDGDAEAATIYAEWLPSSPYAWLKRGVLDEPRPGVLGHPTVLEAARALARQLIHNATFGRPDGSRVARGATGNMLGQISLAWRSDPSILETLHDWLRDDDDESFNGALRAFWGVPLTPEIVATAQDALARRLASLHDEAGSGMRSFDAPFWLLWIDEMRFTMALRAAITPLAVPSTGLGCVAGGVLLPLLGPEDAAKLAAMMAPFGITLDDASLERELLRRYILAAEDAWVAAAVAEIEQGWLMSGSSGLRLMELVSAEHRAVVADALRRSPAFRNELHWVRAREDDLACVRPADIVRKVAFELGL